MSDMDKNIVSGSKEHLFDVLIRSERQINNTGLTNIGDLLFNRLNRRDENAVVLSRHL
jgi:hypothetical protein